MVQCPVCQKEFGSRRYLTSHLQQTQCLNAMHGLHLCQEQKNSDRKVLANTHLESTNQKTHSPHVDQKYQMEIYKCPLAVNVAGDIVFLDNDNCDDTSYCGILGEGEENDVGKNDKDVTIDAIIQPMIQENDRGIDTYHPTTTQLIQADESFSVPLFPDEKVIPMLRIIEAVRQAGAPLILVDRIAKIIIEEAQGGRLDIPNLTTHRTAMK